MKLLLDENVPMQMVSELKRAGHDVEHTNRKCRGFSDDKVLEYALRKQRTIITFDSDFCGFKRKDHYGIIKVNGKMKDPITAIIELLDKEKSANMANTYYQIDLNGVYKEEKKFAKKHKWRFKQFHKTYVELECLQKVKN